MLFGSPCGVLSAVNKASQKCAPRSVRSFTRGKLAMLISFGTKSNYAQATPWMNKVLGKLRRRPATPPTATTERPSRRGLVFLRIKYLCFLHPQKRSAETFSRTFFSLEIDSNKKSVVLNRIEVPPVGCPGFGFQNGIC